MATVNGASALGLDAGLVTFEPGPVAGIIAVDIDPDNQADSLVQALSTDVAPHWVVEPGLIALPRAHRSGASSRR